MNHATTIARCVLSLLIMFAAASSAEPGRSSISAATVTARAVQLRSSAKPTSASTTRSSSCVTPEFRQFDFWLGAWDVFDVDKPQTAIAHARITQILDGCVILEDYAQTDGLHGQSFNIYDATAGVWRQSWVTNRGQFLLLEGKRKEDGMAFTGSDRTSSGEQRQVRATWQPVQGGVRETAVTSVDGGKTWKPWFDIIFRAHRP